MSVGIVYIAEMSVKLCILTYFSGSKIKQNLALKPCENEAKHKLPHDIRQKCNCGSDRLKEFVTKIDTQQIKDQKSH